MNGTTIVLLSVEGLDDLTATTDPSVRLDWRASYAGRATTPVATAPSAASYADDNRVRDEILGGTGSSGLVAGSPAPAPPPARPQQYEMAAETISASLVSADSGGDEERGGEQYAQNVPQGPPPPPVPTPTGGTQHAAADAAARIADDAHRGPLLVYTATVFLSVFEVERTERAVIDIARELGGFLSLQKSADPVLRGRALRAHGGRIGTRLSLWRHDGLCLGRRVRGRPVPAAGPRRRAM